MGWVVSVTPRPRFSPGESTPGTGGWEGPRAGLDSEAAGKILSPLSGIKSRSPSRPARSQTLYGLSYPAHSFVESQIELPVKTVFKILDCVLMHAHFSLIVCMKIRFLHWK
jgi:hypothetical protein